jgi:hypothetical protein
MISYLIQYAPAETTRYMIAGYSVIFSIMLLYVISIFIRFRKTTRDLQTMDELESTEK